MIQKILTCLASLLLYFQIQAQSNQLHPGDIAIIAFQSDNNDQFAFLCLVDMAPSTQIQFSEKGWNASLSNPAFVSTSEGVHTWTSPNNSIPRGTVIVVSFNNLGTSPIANFGTIQSTAAAKLSTSGDELIAFQGSPANPSFIYAFSSRPWINTGTPTSNQSWLPATLINGISARDFSTENDNQYFKLTDYSDIKDSILTAIGNTKNWTRSNTRFSNLPNWHFEISSQYFLKPLANPTLLDSWGPLTDGSGTAPASFLENAALFHISNQSGIIALTNHWTLENLLIPENVFLSIGKYQLSVNELKDSSKGFLMGSDESNLEIRGKSGALRFDNNHAILNKLTLTKSASTHLMSPLKINSNQQIGIVTLGDSATLFTNGFLILSSSERGSSVLAAMGKSAVISGSVEVQKYIPSGKRSFRFLAHPFANSLSLLQLMADIDITGIQGSSNGFTPTNTNNPSAFWYNPIVGDVSQNEMGWTAFTHTNGLGANGWYPKQGIRLNIRGSKGEGLNGLPYIPSAIILHLHDSLNTGDQTAILTKNSSNAGFNLLGNPFASPIDMSKLQIGDHINPNYYLWDPYLGNKGGYACYPFSNSISLPSFAAFFAQTRDSSLGNQILFPETCKNSSGDFLKVLGVSEKITNQLELIVQSDSIIWDRSVIIFKTDASDSVDIYDAKKLMNPELNLFSWSSEKVRLCIDTRSSLHANRIPLGLLATIPKTYQIKVTQFPAIAGFDFYLIDKLKVTKTLLKSGGIYSFQVDSFPLPKDSIRFEIQMLANSIPMNTIEVSKLSCLAFPNPTGDQISLSIQSPQLLPINISVCNALGQSLLKKDLAPSHQVLFEVNMDKWRSGIYFITISNKEEKIVQKIIKY